MRYRNRKHHPRLCFLHRDSQHSNAPAPPWLDGFKAAAIATAELTLLASALGRRKFNCTSFIVGHQQIRALPEEISLANYCGKNMKGKRPRAMQRTRPPTFAKL
jgi:hypothetical protein